MVNKIPLYFLVGITFYISSIYLSRADDRSDARGQSMSNATVVSSRGIDAYGINPANYDFRVFRKEDSLSKKSKQNKTQLKHRLEISLFSLGGGYGSDASMDFYNNYLKYLSVNRATFSGLFTNFEDVINFRQNVLPEKETNVNYDLELKWFSVNYQIPKAGALNFTISDRAGLNTDVLSRDDYLPATYSLTFNPDGSYNLTNIHLHQSQATAWWIRKYSLGYAKQYDFKGFIKNVSFGITGSLVHGFGNVITYNSTLDINTYGVKAVETGNHVDSIVGKQGFYSEAALTDFFMDYRDGARNHFNFFPKPAGKGFGIDLGFTMQLGDYIKIAASVTDLGKITWDYNTIVNLDTNHFLYTNFVLTPSDPTYNAFVNDLDGFSTRDTINPYSTDLPTRYRAGIMYQPSDRLLIELDWTEGKNDFPGNSIKSVFALGSEYYALKYLPVRAGLSVGGAETFTVSVGAGLRFKYISLDLAAYGINNIIANKRLSLSLSGKLII